MIFFSKIHTDNQLRDEDQRTEPNEIRFDGELRYVCIADWNLFRWLRVSIRLAIRATGWWSSFGDWNDGVSG